MTTFVRLVRLTAPFKRSLAVAAALSFLTIASGVALTATSAYLIARAAVVSEVAVLGIAIAGVRVFAISRAAFRYLERLVSHGATFRILAHLRSWFYEAIEPLAPARLSGYRSGDLLSRSVADVETLDGFYIRVLVPPAAAALSAAFACVLLGAFGWALALVLLAFLIAAGVALPVAMLRLGERSSADVVAIRSELNTLLVDEVQGMADLLVFDRADEHRACVTSASRALIRAQERMAMLRGLSNALTAGLTSLAAIVVLWMAIPLVSGGSVKPVYLALLPLVAVAAFEAVQPLSSALQQLEGNRAAGRRLFELIDAPPDVREPGDPLPPPARFSLDVRDLSFRYAAGDALALDGVSLRIPAGGRIGIAGPSGAGKSTLVNLLLRFWEYGDGRITLGSHELRDYRADDVRSVIGVMPQTVHLFNATVRDNLLLADADATDAQIADACRQALLEDVIERLPHGYDTMIGENGALLSGGERQRLAIARVILKGAPIVVLDEPTANLDPRTERELMASIEQFLASRTVLIISHRAAALARVDEIIELGRGRVVHEGSARADGRSRAANQARVAEHEIASAPSLLGD